MAAHRDNDIFNHLDTLEGIHLSDAVKLVIEYGISSTNLELP